MEDKDRKPEHESEDTSLDRPSDQGGDLDEYVDEHPAQSERQRAFTTAFSSFTQLAGPVFNPVLSRITPDHISKILDNTENESVRAYNASESESIREHESESSRRKYQFAYATLVALVVVGLIVFFTLSDNRDLIAPLVAAVAGFLGGFAAGQRFRP